jgi:hypothetical protein
MHLKGAERVDVLRQKRRNFCQFVLIPKVKNFLEHFTVERLFCVSKETLFRVLAVIAECHGVVWVAVVMAN